MQVLIPLQMVVPSLAFLLFFSIAQAQTPSPTPSESTLEKKNAKIEKSGLLSVFGKSGTKSALKYSRSFTKIKVHTESIKNDEDKQTLDRVFAHKKDHFAGCRFDDRVSKFKMRCNVTQHNGRIIKVDWHYLPRGSLPLRPCLEEKLLELELPNVQQSGFGVVFEVNE